MKKPLGFLTLVCCKKLVLGAKELIQRSIGSGAAFSYNERYVLRSNKKDLVRTQVKPSALTGLGDFTEVGW